LVCAPSNAAIDEVASRIKDASRSAIKVVRIGAEKSLNASTKDISLESLVEERLAGNSGPKDQTDEYARLSAALATVRQALKEKENEVSVIIDNTARAKMLEDERQTLINQRRELSKKLNTLRDDNMKAGRNMDSDRRKVRMAVLAEADVICCTLSGSGHDVLEALDFEMIIIDEAAQAIELSTLIPLRFNCAKCIMVGDPQQLPPTVISKEATKFHYNQSLFVRLQKQRPEAVHLLSIQYRMHPEISLFPSQLFYQGRLQDGPGMAERTKRVWQDNPRFGIYRFFNVIGSQESSVGFSATNPTEVQIAVQLYARLTKEFPSINFASRVGFITPYREQLKALRLAFRKRFGEDIVSSVDFNTVDGFQGQEKDIIVLSCVRAGPALESIGFLRDERRMNVALTRAKCSLFVLGHAPTLERSDENWRSLIQDARKRSLLLDVNSSFFTSAGAIPAPRPTSRVLSPGTKTLPPRPSKALEQSNATSPTKLDLMTPAQMRSKAVNLPTEAGLASRRHGSSSNTPTTATGDIPASNPASVVEDPKKLQKAATCCRRDFDGRGSPDQSQGSSSKKAKAEANQHVLAQEKASGPLELLERRVIDTPLHHWSIHIYFNLLHHCINSHSTTPHDNLSPSVLIFQHKIIKQLVHCLPVYSILLPETPILQARILE